MVPPEPPERPAAKSYRHSLEAVRLILRELSAFVEQGAPEAAIAGLEALRAQLDALAQFQAWQETTEPLTRDEHRARTRAARSAAGYKRWDRQRAREQDQQAPSEAGEAP